MLSSLGRCGPPVDGREPGTDGPPSPSDDPSDPRDGEPVRPLLAERLRRLAVPVTIVLSVMLVVTLAYQGPMTGAVLIAIGVVAVIAWLRTSSGGDDEDRYGPGA